MQRFSHRESVLLGYSPPNTPVTDSDIDIDIDIDFNDVFGGPPRRSSVQETRHHRFSEDMDPYSSSGFRSSDGTTSFSASRLSGLSEKPVFGEEGMNRRRQSRSDFYDDIFGGNEGSPRKEPFALTSQLSSPARFPLTAEPSLPTRFSLMNKGMDLGSPTGTTSRSKDGCSNVSRFSDQPNQDKGEPRNDSQSSSRFSALSQELSAAQEAEDSISLTKYSNGGGNGRVEERDKLQRCSSAKGWIACESIAMESESESESKLDNSFRSTDGIRMSANAKSFRVERHDNVILSSPIDSRNGDGERVPSIRGENTPVSEPEIKRSLSQIVLCDKQEDETKKAHPNTLKMLFHKEDCYERGDDGMSKNDGTKDIPGKSRKKLYEILDDENVKKPDTTKRDTSNNMEAGKTRVKGSRKNSRDNGKGRVRGKVKDFIKIFNQDASPKPKPDTVHESHSSRWPERQAIKPDYEPSDCMSEREVKFHMPDVQEQKSSPEFTILNHMLNGAAEKNIDNSVTDLVSNGFNTIIDDPTDSVDDNFIIEDLTPEEKIFPDLGIDPEEIKAIDAKIQQWSSGKEGNIRSLLSTLQYVLWPNSGWKPVALVDIIEGPAVKRSYQKALLCVHPDKLQQKGAASDIKYIAERVLDVLQDAWTHFNSLGSV
ncbi:hypothetical protein V6N13_001361 [Hibiscus sabdariffa]|uniref:J domain-containing protein required for chloroplast accumulation response 1 n=1 Tax=Hibiscus sabdariffa TaxID=183260 RepID=A0ABR2G9K0_9ROSI